MQKKKEEAQLYSSFNFHIRFTLYPPSKCLPDIAKLTYTYRTAIIHRQKDAMPCHGTRSQCKNYLLNPVPRARFIHRILYRYMYSRVETVVAQLGVLILVGTSFSFRHFNPTQPNPIQSNQIESRLVLLAALLDLQK